MGISHGIISAIKIKADKLALAGVARRMYNEIEDVLTERRRAEEQRIKNAKEEMAYLDFGLLDLNRKFVKKLQPDENEAKEIKKYI